MSGVKYISPTDRRIADGISVKRMVISLALTVVTVLILLFASALLLTYTGIKMDSAVVISRIILFVGAFASGFWNGAGGKRSGWLQGMLSGALYMLIITVVGLFVGDGKLALAKIIINILSGIVLGAIGGIVGINSGRSKKYKKKK